LISIYAADGSVQLTHGGIEIGQGIHTVAAQACAYALNIPIELITVRHTDTFVNPNSRDTGGSITTHLNCKAVIECCKLINQKLDPIRQIMPSGYSWQDLIAKAKSIGVDLCTHYWVYHPDGPNNYRIYGAACAETTIDILTGEVQVDRIDILYDCGQPLNPEIDIGQAEGAFVQGIGFWLTEQIKYDPNTGKNLTNGTWEYKVPTTKDIPIDFRVRFLKDNTNPNVGFLGAKSIGEPPICLSLSVFHSIRHAIEAARYELGQSEFFVLNSPLTVEQVQQACLVNYSQFKLNA
jgi:xanthine dehydrogenase/oxidase